MLYLTNKSFTKRENWYGGKAIDQHCDNISVNHVYLVKIASDKQKNDGRQVNKKFRKFESKYRDCIKRNGDKIGTQTCYDISTYP